MKRLVKKARRIGSTARFINKPNEVGVCTIIGLGDGGTYNLTCQSGNYDGVVDSEIVDGDGFIPGDNVRYEKHPYDNKAIFIVKDVLQDGNYYIENEQTSYTNINKRSLEFA